MKKLIAVLLTLVIVFPLAACGGKKTGTESTDPAVPATDGSGEAITDANGNVLPANLPVGAINGIRETFDPMEYTIYMNVFQDISSKQFDGIEMDKKGTFAILQDDWSGKTRYYVWGYNDTTRCCDYQWEFVPADVSALPEPGSYIRVQGTLTYTEDRNKGDAASASPLSDDQVRKLCVDEVHAAMKELSAYKHPRRIQVRFDPLQKTNTLKVKRYLYSLDGDAGEG